MTTVIALRQSILDWQKSISVTFTILCYYHKNKAERLKHELKLFVGALSMFFTGADCQIKASHEEQEFLAME